MIKFYSANYYCKSYKSSIIWNVYTFEYSTIFS